MAGVERHDIVVGGEDGELLAAALFVNGAEGPESWLGEEEAGMGSVAGGEGADEGSVSGEFEEFPAGKLTSVAIDFDVVVILKLEGELGRGLAGEEGIDLKDGGAFLCR